MKRPRPWLLGLGAISVLFAVGFHLTRYWDTELERKCAQIKYGMSLEDVEKVIGRKRDRTALGVYQMPKSGLYPPLFAYGEDSYAGYSPGDAMMAWGTSCAGPFNSMPWLMPAWVSNWSYWDFGEGEFIEVERGRADEVIHVKFQRNRLNKSVWDRIRDAVRTLF